MEKRKMANPEELNPVAANDRSVTSDRANPTPDFRTNWSEFNQVKAAFSPQSKNLGLPSLTLTDSLNQSDNVAASNQVALQSPEGQRPHEHGAETGKPGSAGDSSSESGYRGLGPSQGRPFPPMHGVDAQYREDGSLESASEQRGDGSTRFSRYYQPNNRSEVDAQHENGIDAQYTPSGSLEEETIVSPDGSSSYSHFSTDGRADLIQRTNSNGDIETYTRNEAGVLEGSIRYADGGTASGTFNDDLSPRNAQYELADGTTRSVVFNQEANTSTDTTTSPDGTTRLISRNLRTGSTWDETTNPDGSSHLVQELPADGLSSVRTIAADGTSRTVTHDRNRGTSYEATINPDGSRRTIDTAANGATEDVTYNPDRSIRRRANFDPASGITTEVTNNPNGSQVTTRTQNDASVIDTAITHPDRTQTVTVNRPDGSSEITRLSPIGDRIGSIEVPRGAEVEHRDNGGMAITYTDGAGNVTRAMSIDGNGNFLTETSFHPNGRPREVITYGAGTRT